MKYCDDCQVNVDIPATKCPLCYTFLRQKDDTPERISYPNLQQQAETYNLLLRILLFLSLTAVAVSVTINLLTLKTYYWSFVVVAVILYAWIAIGTAIRRGKSLGYNIMIQVVSLSVFIFILSFIFDFKGVVSTYVLPALFVSATLSITVIVIIKHVDVQSFILYFILIALLGFIPLLLMALGLTTVSWPAIVSALYSGISLVSLFIFADASTKKELRKRFNL